MTDAPRWRPIAEAPRDGTDVLVSAPGKRVDIGYFCEEDGEWFVGDWRYGDEGPTHWMPLPAPPRGEDG